MDVTLLSRLQFAAATYFHFLFVPLTLGLSILLAVMETAYIRTKNEEYKEMTQFWGKIFLLNFVVGVATGITLEFQFGTNWSRYSRYVGDIFGPLLAIESTVAFFLESTFIGVWALGWKRLSPRLHAASIWLVAIASNVSAIPEICGDAALYCDPADPADIARQVEHLLQSRQLRAELRQAGYQRTRQFSWAAAAAQLQGIVSRGIAGTLYA